MSHSKRTKRGYSLYLDKWNPSATQYIHTCVLCGRKGYSPAIELEGFCDDYKNRAIYTELKKTMTLLKLDEHGRCETCARIMDAKD